MYAIFSALPIALVIILMSFFKQKASSALLFGWVLAVLLSILIWNMEVVHAAAWTLFGFLSAIGVLLIIFAAIFMLNTLLELRFIETIGNGFSGITQDRRIQIIIIAWFFGAFIEGAAGFGTPQAIAAPLLVGLGVPAFFAAMAALIANAGATIFGAAGTPTTAGWNSIVDSVIYQYGEYTAASIFAELNNRIALTNIFISVFLPFIMIASVTARDGRKRGIKDALPVLPLCIFAGLVYAIPSWFVSFLGPQLPTLAGAIIGMPIFLLIVKLGFLVPKDTYRFIDDKIKESKKVATTGIPLVTAWLPYAIIILVLVITRLPWLGFDSYLNPLNAHVSITSILGFEGINWSFNPLWNPGIFPFIPVTILLLVFRKTEVKVVTKITVKTLKQLKHASVALFFGVALVQIMLNTNFTNPTAGPNAMTSEIALALSSLFGGAYLAVAPFIGILGSFVSGSTTVSNIMFYGLQMEAALALNLPIVISLVAQTMGASAGNMVAINNIVAVSATTGYNGKESTLMVATLIPMVLYALAVAVVLYTFFAIGIRLG